MKRIAIAGLAGAVVLFVWSSISWMLIPWHVMEKLPGEEGIRQMRAVKYALDPHGILGPENIF